MANGSGASMEIGTGIGAHREEIVYARQACQSRARSRERWLKLQTGVGYHLIRI